MGNESSPLRDTVAADASASRREPSPAEKRMATEKVSRLLLSYSIPSIIGMLVNALYNVVDRFWVGKIEGIGRDALTGIGLCMPAMNIMMAFSMLIGIGAAATISIRLGRNNHDEAEHILGNAFSLIFIVGFAVSALGFVFAEPILAAFGADENVLPYALDYYLITVGGYIFSIISFGMNHPIRATGNPRRFASTQLLGGILNMILDPIFIFTFNWGIKGAAAATVVSQAIAATWVVSYYFMGKPPLRLHRRYLLPNKKIILAIFSIGLSPFLLQIAGSAVSIVVNHSLRFYGSLTLSDGNIAISAMTVIQSIAMLFLMPVFGINQGSQPIVGFNYGAKDFSRVMQTYKWSVIYACSICSLGFAAIMLFAPQLIQLFNGDLELIAVGSSGMRVFLFAIPLVGFQVTTVNFFQSIGRAKISILLSLMRQVIILIPAYIVLPRFLGLSGIWLAGPVTDLLSVIITFFFIRKELGKLGKMQNGL